MLPTFSTAIQTFAAQNTMIVEAICQPSTTP
jgi:hypothetical protein